MLRCFTIYGRSELDAKLRPTHDWAAMLTGQYAHLDSVWTTILPNGDLAITVGRHTPDYAVDHLLEFAASNNLQVTLGCTTCPRHPDYCNTRSLK